MNTDENSPAAACLTINDPIAEGERIARDKKAGFIVWTWVDANTWEARKGNLIRVRGAEYISTDYLWAGPRLPGYCVASLDGETVRCKVVRSAAEYPADCS